MTGANVAGAPTVYAWNTKLDGTGTQYLVGETVSGLTGENGTTLVLYAQWSFDVMVGDVLVTEHNYENITGGSIVSGKVSYEHNTKTLTLENVSIVGGTDGVGMIHLPKMADTNPYTIKLVGKNTIEAQWSSGNIHRSYGIYSAEELTITGNGSLEVSTTNGRATFNTSIYCDAYMVKILDGASVTVVSYNGYESIGVKLKEDSKGSIFVENATLTASGNTKATNAKSVYYLWPKDENGNRIEEANLPNAKYFTTG